MSVGTTSGSLFQTNLANATSIAADANGVLIVGSGGGGSITITGDTGTDTGSTFAFTATPNSGATAAFNVTAGSVDLTLTDINGNTLLGQGAGSANTLLADGGSSNVTLGQISGASLGAASNNVLIGAFCGNGLLTGNANVIAGSGSGTAYVGAESGNIILANTGVVGESNTIRIGDPVTITSCFVGGIFGVTVGVTGIPVVVDTDGQVGTVVSSKRFKENIQEIKSSKITDLTPVSFQYKKPENAPANYKHDYSVHYGMIAEDVDLIMPELVVYDEEKPFTIKYHEMYALLLAEIKCLRQEVNDLKNRVA